MLNKAQLIGNLGQDPKVEITNGGRAVATFSLATNRRWKDLDGEPQEATDWHNIVCWGPKAKLAEEYLTKGRLVYVEGRLQTSKWEDDEGVTRYRTEIVCEQIQMLGPQQEGTTIPAEEPAAEPPEPETGAAGEEATEPT